MLRDIDIALREAILTGETDTVNSLLDQGAEINIQDKFGRTPLHIAAERGYTSVANRLLEQGAEVNIQDAWQRIPLHHAAQHGHTAIANHLLDKGSETTTQDSQGLIPLHHAAAWYDPATVNSLPGPTSRLVIENYPSISHDLKKGKQDHTDLVKSLVYHLLLRTPEAEKPAGLMLDCWDNIKKNIKTIYDLLNKPSKGKVKDAIKLLSIAVEVINKLPKHVQTCIGQIAPNTASEHCPLASEVLKRPLLTLPESVTWNIIQYLNIKDGINYVLSYEHPTNLPAVENAGFPIVNN